MKKSILPLMLLAVCFYNQSQAQTTFEIIPMGGYTFPDQINFYNNYGRIEGTVNYGGSMQLNVSRGFGIEFMYNRLEPNTGLYQYDYSNQNAISQQKAVFNYIMAGPVSSIGFGRSVRWFFGAELGAAVIDPRPIDYTSNTKFAWGAETGVNLYLAPGIGIRMKGQLLSVVGSSNGGYYFGDFGGPGVYAYSATAIYQFGISAGLIIGLGNVLPQPHPKVIIHKRYPQPQAQPKYYYQPNPYYYKY